MILGDVDGNRPVSDKPMYDVAVLVVTDLTQGKVTFSTATSVATRFSPCLAVP